jgi:glucosamine kinase
VASIDDLVRAANATPPADFSRLFPAVLEAADGGDTIARETLVAAGVQLADLARVVLQRLFPDVYASVPVAMAGGVLRQSALVRQSFFNHVRAAFPTALVNPTLMEPVLGALELARNRATSLALASGKGAQP